MYIYLNIKGIILFVLYYNLLLPHKYMYIIMCFHIKKYAPVYHFNWLPFSPVYEISFFLTHCQFSLGELVTFLLETTLQWMFLYVRLWVLIWLFLWADFPSMKFQGPGEHHFTDFSPGNTILPIFAPPRVHKSACLFLCRYTDIKNHHSGGKKMHWSVVLICGSLIPSAVEDFLNMFVAICVSSFMNSISTLHLLFS